MCSFCVIPFARGRARSRDWDDLFREVRQMIGQGVREFIHGRNLGLTNQRKDFLALIHSLAEMPGLERLRISRRADHYTKRAFYDGGPIIP